MLRCILIQVYEGSVSFFLRMILMHTLERVEKAKRKKHYDFFSLANFFQFCCPATTVLSMNLVYIAPRSLSML
jgi:hypothetical protein